MRWDPVTICSPRLTQSSCDFLCRNVSRPKKCQRVGDHLDAGSWTLGDDNLLDQTREILALRGQVDALLLDTIAEVEARGLAARRACSSTRAWLRSAHRIAPGEAAKLVRTTSTLRTELPAVAQAMGSGAVSLAQAGCARWQ